MTTRPAAPPLTAEEEADIRQRAGQWTDDGWLRRDVPQPPDPMTLTRRDRNVLLRELDREREARADERARLRAAVEALPTNYTVWTGPRTQSGSEWPLVHLRDVLALLADPPFVTAPVPGLEQYVEVEPRRRIAVGEGTCIVCQRTRAARRRAALFRVCCYVGIVFATGVLVGSWLTR